MSPEIDFNTIPKVVINLPHRTDRMKYVVNELLYLKLDKTRVMFSPGIIDTPPSKGVGKAHLQAMESAFVNPDTQAALIIEDDVIFPGRLKTLDFLHSCIQNAPKDWDILLGGALTENGFKDCNQYWQEIIDFRGLQFYVITREAFERVKKGYKFNNHIDKWMANNGLKIYVTSPFCAMQRDGYSDNVMRPTKYYSLYSKRYKLLKSI